MAWLLEPGQPGKREDLSNLLVLVDAEDLPFMTVVRKGKPVRNTLYEFQHDAFDDANTDGVPDGSDVSDFKDKSTHRKKLYGRIQKFRRTWGVGDIAENVSDVAGVANEVAYAKAKCLTELKRDMEAAMCSDNESQADDGTNGSKLRGFGKWISASAQSDLPVEAEYLSPSAHVNTTAMASVVDATLNGVLGSLFTETRQKKKYFALCGYLFKQAVTALTQYQSGVSSSIAAVRLWNHNDLRKITASVDFYEGDTGQMELHLSTWLGFGTTDAPNRRCYVINPEKVEIRPNRMPRQKELEDKGGGRRGFIDSIMALQVHSPLAHGKFAATT